MKKMKSDRSYVQNRKNRQENAETIDKNKQNKYNEITKKYSKKCYSLGRKIKKNGGKIG